MDKFKKSIEELDTYYDKWLFILKNLHLLDEIPPELREKSFQKLFNVAEIAKYNPKDRQTYENSLKYYRDMENSLDLQYKIGQKEKGIEIAKKLLKRNLSNEDIAEDTGLSIEQIETLRKEL
jgi:predicted transposase/invertase (TIGR01784 family)